MSDPMLNLALFIAAVFAAGQWFRSRDVLKRCEEFEKQLKENHMSDFDLYEPEIEELYQKPEEPKVKLTVEEAKMLEDMALRWMFLNPKNVTLKSAQLMKQLSKRIEEAEGK